MSKWEMVKLGDYITQIRGVSYAPKDISDKCVEGYIPLLRAHNIQADGLNMNNLVYVKKEKVKESQLINIGDIIVCTSSGSKSLIGKAAQAKMDMQVSLGSFCKLIRVRNAHEGYVGNFFKSNKYRTIISNLSEGANINNLRNEHIDRLTIPLPPLDFQKYIANTLDKAQEIIDVHKKQLEELDNLIKAVFYEMFGDPVENPYKWEVKKLSDIANYFIGLTYKPEDIANEGIIVLRSSNIQNDSLDFNDIVRVNKEVKDKLKVQDGDILMCSRNGSKRLVGKTALIKNLNEEMTFGAFMTIIRSKYNSYLLTYFKTEAFRRQIFTGETTTINQITKNMLDRISIPLPPLDLQTKFAQIVSKVEEQKAIVKESIKESEKLFNSLMSRYFD